MSLFEIKYTPSYDLSKYSVRKIDMITAKNYICKNHYSHGCHNAPSPCYGLYDMNHLIGVLMFAIPCSENVRASLFGEEYKDNVIELHRLHILDVTSKNAESWFISRCLKLLVIDRPQTWGVISFADSTQGHTGIIYKATNFLRCGTTGSSSTFYMDCSGRLHHPRQNGINVDKEEASKRDWTPVKREFKYRYIKIVGNNKKEIKERTKLLKLKYESISNNISG